MCFKETNITDSYHGLQSLDKDHKQNHRLLNQTSANWSIYSKNSTSNCGDKEQHIYSEQFNCKTYDHYVNKTQDLEKKLFGYWTIIASVYIILM